MQQLIKQGKKRDCKLIIRENDWPISSTVRTPLWIALCDQHQVGKTMLEGFYWEMCNQVRIEEIINQFTDGFCWDL